jgi:hypothetical protein
LLARTYFNTTLHGIQTSRSIGHRAANAERCLLAHDFQPSYPLADFSRHLVRGFFALDTPLLLPIGDSRCAILMDSTEIFLPAFDIDFAVASLPIVNGPLLQRCRFLFAELQSRKMIGTLTMQQVFQGLRSKPLSVAQLVRVLAWFCRVPRHVLGSAQTAADLLKGLTWVCPPVDQDSDDEEDSTCKFADIQYFFGKPKFHVPLAAPRNVLPAAISDALDPYRLTEQLGLKQLTLTSFLSSVVQHSSHFSRPQSAAVVLAFACAQRRSLTQSDRFVVYM